MNVQSITSFKKEYTFLSNFYPVNVEFDGDCYPSVEHAYQSAKFPRQKRQKFFDKNMKPGEAKRAGKIETTKAFDDKKIELMASLIKEKFKNESLRKKLLDTGEAFIIEGNWWNDRFWGVCDGVGENHLGIILMNERKRIRDEDT